MFEEDLVDDLSIILYNEKHPMSQHDESKKD